MMCEAHAKGIEKAKPCGFAFMVRRHVCTYTAYAAVLGS